MFELKGKKLYEPQILGQGNRPVPFSDFTNRKVKNAEPLRVGNDEWALVYSKRDYDLTNKIVEAL